MAQNVNPSASGADSFGKSGTEWFEIFCNKYTATSLAITANVFTATANSMTSGDVLNLSTSNAGFTGQIIDAVISNSGASGTGLKITNEGTGNGILIDQNGNGIALNIDSESTTATQVLAISSVSTTGDIIAATGTALTTGNVAQFVSSGALHTGSNIFISTSNAGASGKALEIQNVGTGDGIFINQDGNGKALNIDSESTTVPPLDINADALTTAGCNIQTTSAGFTNLTGLLNVVATAGSGTTLRARAEGSGIALDVDQQGTGIGLQIQNPGTANALFINQDGNGIALNIDSESTTANTISVSSTNTTGIGFALTATALTGGNAFRIEGTGGTHTAALGFFFSNNASHSGNTLQVQNLGTGSAVLIDQDSNSIALNIDSESTTAAQVVAISSVSTTGDVIAATGTALTTGNMAQFVSSGALHTGANVFVQTSNAGASGNAIEVENAGTGNGIFINQDGNAIALNIDSEATTVSSISVTNAGTATAGGILRATNSTITTGSLISLDNANALTTGAFLDMSTTNATSGTAGLLRVSSSSTSSTNTLAVFSHFGTGAGIGVRIISNGTGDALFLDKNGNGIALNIDSESTTANTISVSSTNTTGIGFELTATALTGGNAFKVSGTGGSHTAALAFIHSNNASHTGNVLQVQNSNSTGAAIFIDQDSNAIALNIDSESTSAKVLSITAVTTTGQVLDIVGNSMTTGNMVQFTCSTAQSGGSLLVVSGTGARTSAAAAFRVLQSNASATSDASSILNAGTGDGFFIDQDGDGIALNIDTESTGKPAMQIIGEQISIAGSILLAFNSLTTGHGINQALNSLTSGLGITQASSSTAFTGFGLYHGTLTGNNAAVTGAVYHANVSGALSTAIGMRIVNSGTGEGLTITASAVANPFIDSRGAGVFTGTGASSAHYFALTNGSSTGTLLFLDHDGSGIGLQIDNLGAGNGLFINQDGNGVALNIDSESTTADVINIDTVITTGKGIDITANSLTTGNALSVFSNANRNAAVALANFQDFGASNAGNVLAIVQFGASSTGRAVSVQNEGTGPSFFIDQNGNGIGLNVDSIATTVPLIQSIGSGVHTGTGTTAAHHFSLTSSSSTGNLLFLNHDGNGISLNIDSEATTANTVSISSANTTGFGIALTTTALTSGNALSVIGTGGTHTAALVNFFSNNASHSGPVLIVNQTGTGNIFECQDSGTPVFVVEDGGEVQIDNGVLRLGETGTPSADTNFGKMYTKTDNKLFFQDGAGVEHEVAFV